MWALRALMSACQMYIIKVTIKTVFTNHNLFEEKGEPSGIEPRSFCLPVGRTSLSLALGNMVVARQILLIFNLSYLPCSVQFVNKNYCHAKNDLFTTCWCHYFVREWCIVSLEEVLMNTPSGRKPSVVLTSKVRWARSENGCVRKTVGNFYKKNVQTWSYTF